MYGVGDRVMYGAHGVCRVSGTEERTIDRKKRIYLVLEPAVGASAKYYVPTFNETAMAKLSPILTQNELEGLLSSPEVRDAYWIPDENRRKQSYRELITSGDRTRLVRAIYTLYRHRDRQSAAGRKVHICDENFLHDAERVVTGEIELILGMDSRTAREYLQQKLSV